MKETKRILNHCSVNYARVFWDEKNQIIEGIIENKGQISIVDLEKLFKHFGIDMIFHREMPNFVREWEYGKSKIENLEEDSDGYETPVDDLSVVSKEIISQIWNCNFPNETIDEICKNIIDLSKKFIEKKKFEIEINESRLLEYLKSKVFLTSEKDPLSFDSEWWDRESKTYGSLYNPESLEEIKIAISQ